MSNKMIFVSSVLLCVGVSAENGRKSVSTSSDVIDLHAKSSRLLFITIPSYSHLNLFAAIGIQLCQSSKYKHQCTFAIFNEQVDHLQSISNKFSSVNLGPIPKPPNIKPNLHQTETLLQHQSSFILPLFSSFYKPMHNALIEHLKSNQYDLLIIDMLAFAAQDIAYDLRLPYIIQAYTTVEGHMTLPSWIPQGYDTMTPDELALSSIKRFYNKFIVTAQILYYLWPQIRKLDQIRTECNRTKHGLFSTPISKRWNGHPVLLPYPQTFDFKRQMPCNYYYVGFIVDMNGERESKSQDDKNVEQWINEKSEDEQNNEFVLYVAFGTLTRLTELQWLSILNIINYLPQLRLLLAVNDKSMYNFLLNHNLTISVSSHRLLIHQWINQKFVLEHDQIKFFVNHGGLNSIGESVYAHKPILVLPGFGDQQANGVKVLEQQIGLVLQRNVLSSKALADKIEELLINEKLMKGNLIKLHQISEVNDGGGAKMAAKLIDRWLLIGYKHLDTTENHLSNVNYFELDLKFISGLIVIVVLLVIKMILNRLLPKEKIKTIRHDIKKKQY